MGDCEATISGGGGGGREKGNGSAETGGRLQKKDEPEGDCCAYKTRSLL